jgi:hypothetical protein
MNKNLLKRLIRELVDEELKEVSTSDGAGPYNTPYAFRGNTADGKAKAKKIAGQAGMEPVKGREVGKADDAGPQDSKPVKFGEASAGALKSPKKEKVVQERKRQ